LTDAVSIYRRLNAGTRPSGQWARELGLLEG
jgi:hypothetical protein